MKRLRIDISEQTQRQSKLKCIDIYGKVGDTTYRIGTVTDSNTFTVRNDDGYDLTITYKKREDKKDA